MILEYTSEEEDRHARAWKLFVSIRNRMMEVDSRKSAEVPCDFRKMAKIIAEKRSVAPPNNWSDKMAEDFAKMND